MTSALSYRASIVGLVALGVTAVVAVQIFRPGDNMAFIASIFAFVSSTWALLKVNETHAIVNSRMDEFKRELEKASRLSNIAARAEGVESGKEAGREAANVRTDAIASQVATQPQKLGVKLKIDGQ